MFKNVCETKMTGSVRVVGGGGGGEGREGGTKARERMNRLLCSFNGTVRNKMLVFELPCQKGKGYTLFCVLCLCCL